LKKFYLPPVALVAGFMNAFIAAGVNSLFFCLAPVLAFVFGYFSSWKKGMLCGFMVFSGYTIATALMWRGGLNLLYFGQYIYAFIFGGFSLPLLGALAPLVKNGLRRIGAVVAMVALVVIVVWCGYSALPHYSYYYQVIVQSSEDLDDLELYVPLGHVFGKPYTELYDNPYYLPAVGLSEEYKSEIVDTEYGPMLKLTLNGLEWHKSPDLQYTGNIIFMQKNVSRKLIHLVPRYSIAPVNTVTWGRAIGPVTMRESKVIEKFDVPVIIRSGKDAEIELWLENRTDRGEAINFAYNKSNTYTELVDFRGSTDRDWQFVPVEVMDQLDIRGVGD
jgi:hypothetical protein